MTDRSIPYSADVIEPRDKDLIFAKEFGTNTTLDIGDAFTTVAATDVEANIDARLGMLQVSSLDNATEEDAPRGRTYPLTFDWSALPTSPALGDLPAVCIMAHIPTKYFAELSPVVPRGGLILAPEDMVGEQVALPFLLATTNFATAGPLTLEASSWSDGATQTDGANFDGVGIGGVYVQCILIVDEAKEESSMSVFVAGDGIAWHAVTPAIGIAAVVRRVGLAVTGAGAALLDWVRIYSYVVEDGSEQNFFKPFPPLTGGRIYVPS